MRTVLRDILATVALTAPAALPAQQAAAPAPNTQPAQPSARAEKLFVDSVIASVNDSAILQSRLFMTTRPVIAGKEAELQQPLTDRQIQELILRDLNSVIGDYQMAQAARSFGNIPAERFDSIVDDLVERDKEDLRRDLGDYAAVSRELREDGETWQSYTRGKRIEKMQMIAEQLAIADRLRKQQNLHLTPRMLRETYQKHRSRYVFPAAAVLDMVVFVGADAKNKAREASTWWRTGPHTSREVANRVGGTPLPPEDASKLLPNLREFALAGPTGNVSEPLPRGAAFVVARIREFHEGRNGSFSDPDVQADVRRIARGAVQQEFHLQALNRARDRTEVWIYERGRPVRWPPR